MGLSTPPDAELPPGGVEVGDPAWRPWRPGELAELLAGLRTHWHVAGGWAIDLFIGQQTRDHEDLEIGVPAGAFDEIRTALSAYEFDVVGAGMRWPLASPAFELMHQTWVREPATGVYRLDVFRDPHEGDTWICRRDETIRVPYFDLIRWTADGIPYLRPDVVLLFKAKWSRDKDEADFSMVLPLLGVAEQRWLRDALARVAPSHHWLDRLEALA